MSSSHDETNVLDERFVEDTLSKRLPRLTPEPEQKPTTTDDAKPSPDLGHPYPDEMNTQAFNFVKALANDFSAGELKLPSLPEVVIRVRRALSDEESAVDDIIRVIGSDAVLAARLLHKANSALYYQGVEPITELRSAVSRMGFDAVHNVAMSMALEQLFHGHEIEALQPHLKREWEHGAHVAAISQILAHRTTTLNPDEAFLAGLLHDIGKLYILMRTHDQPGLLSDEVVLHHIMDAWHPAIGGALLEGWELSEALIQAAKEHESYDLEARGRPSLTVVVTVANLLVKKIESGADEETVVKERPRCRSLELPEETCAEVLRDALEEIAHTHHLLGL